MRPEAREEAYRAIDSERDYQDKMWFETGSSGHGLLSIGEEILLIEEYAAKAREAWSKERYPEKTALDIVRKIAGIAVHCMEDHGSIHR